MPATPAGPTLSGETDANDDPIVLTDSGLALTSTHLTVLVAAGGSDRQCNQACGSFPDQVAELQRDGLLSTDRRPALYAYGYNALVLAGWW